MNDPRRPATTIDTHRRARKLRRSSSNRSLFSLLAGVFSRSAAADARRGMFVEPLEERRLLTVGPTLYVANAFYDQTTAANTSTPTAGDTVNWLASGQFAEVDGLTFGTNAFSSIQAAASYAAANDSSGATIDVAAGTYNESPDITSSVTLQGAQHGVDARSGRSGAQESIIIGQISGGAVPDVMDGFTFGSSSGLPGPGPMQTSVAFTNFTFENNLVQNVNSFYLANIAGLQSATIEQNLFRNMDNSSHNASAMNIFGGKNITIENNAIDGTTFSGIQADDDDNLTISGNTVTNVTYNGIQVGSFCSGNIDVTGNTVTGVDTAGASAGPDTGGIRLYGVQAGSTVNVTNNLVTNSYNGLTVVTGSDLSTSSYHVNDNSFAGNTNVGLYNGATTGTLDAGLNWWGAASGPTVGSNPGGTGGAVTANVDYSPWLTTGANSATGTGFQGDLSQLTVNAGSPLANPAIGSIQEAINAAPAGGTVTVAPGTYNEGSISVNKPLTLDGPNKGINPNTGTRVPEAILNATGVPAGGNFIYVGANNVTINGFTVEGSPGGGIVTGDSGGQILDNIVTNNEIGIYADCTGPTLIQGNLITANNVAGSAGGTAIYSDATNGLTINGNVINDQTINSAIIFAASSANVHKNLTVSNNSIEINAPGNSAIYVVAVDGGVFSGNDITANGGGSGIHLAGDDTNISILNNNLVNNTNGVSITDDGYGFGPNAGVTVNDNRFLGNTTGLNVASGANVYSGTSLDATKNWWGDVSGPTIAGNVGGDGQTITAPANLVSYAPWLIYGTNAAPAGTAGFQLPAVVPVTSQGDVSPAVNDFTIIQNAIGAAAAGQTIDLSGTFDWTKPNAAAAYTASNLTADPGHDIRGAALPDGVNNLTITSSNGTAKIIGAGDSTDGVYHSFVFSAVQGVGATGNNNLTISNLNIDNFMSGVTLGWNNGGAFNGTLVKNNTITVAADNNNSLNDVQGIAVYFWNGQNQTMTGNTIDFMGDGTRTIGTGARSLGFQDGTTGANGYQGLSIDHNIFQLLPSAIGGHETVTGIWENGHNDNTGTHISIADNQFLGIQGKRQFDIGVQLSSQSTNMAVDGNTFTDVKYVYWVGAHNGDVAGDQFTFTNNTLTRVGDANGVFLQNVASDATPPYTVTINWGTNNTIDGFTGIRGLNELSTQATGASRPNGAATDLAAVDAFGAMPADYVNGNWGTPGRFTNPLAAPDGTPGPIAFGFNTFDTIQDGVNAIDPAGAVNVLPGAYAENVTIGKNLTLVGATPAGTPASPPTASLQPTSGDGITINAPATNVTVANLAITGADNAINANGVTTLNLTDLTLTGNSSGGTISNVATLNDTPLTGGTGATDTITGATIQRGTDDTINYSNVGNLNVTGSNGSDTFNVTPATTTVISINGGLPTPPALPGDTLNVNSAGLTSPALSYSTTADGDRGKFTFGNAAPVSFQGIETLANVSNLSITNADNSPTPGFEVPGSPITYTIVVANNGPNNVTGAAVSDAFPADLTNISYTATATGGATGYSASGNTSINDTVNLPNGGTITYVIKGTINPAATGTLTNTATVSVSSPIVQTASATDSDTLTPTADLSVTNTDNSPTPGHVQTGQSLTYTVIVTNGGPSDVSGASVADTLPAGFDGASYSAIATGGATGFTAGGSGNINDTVNMPVGSTITYTITGTIDPAATGTLSSVATVGAPLGVTDPDSANNSVTDSNVVSTKADLSITNSDNSPTPGSVVPGTALTYTIVVSNTGPGDVTGATAADTFPADFTGVTYTTTSTGTASGFTANGSGNINDTVDLAVGSTITYIVKGTIAPTATGTLTNTAKITPPADTIDTDTTNNSATDTDTLTPQADITVTKTDNSATPGSAVPGTALTYTITVSNSGPSVATGTSIADLLPADFTGATFTSLASGGATGNTASGSGDISDTVDLPVGGSVVYTVKGTISASAAGTLANTATVAPGAGVTDTNATTSATDSLALTPQADITITKTDNSTTPGKAVPGTALTYTITVSNSGPSVATGTKIADLLPAGFTGATFTSVAGGGATGNTTSGSGDINDTVTLPMGASVVYTVKGTISPAAAGVLTNTANVTPGAGVTDTNATTSATDSLALTPQADITITKTDNSTTPGKAVPGTALTYTITVSNSGPSAATGTSVADMLPADFTGATFTSLASGGATGNTTSGSGNISDTVTLPMGGSVVYTVTGTISASATGTLTNTANVAPGAGVTDTNATTSASDSLTLTPQADITISITDDKGGDSTKPTTGSVVAGTSMTYTIVIGNSGPSDVIGATIADSFPANFTGATYTATATNGAAGFSGNGSGDINDTAVNLPAGSSITYVVTGTIASSAISTLSNAADVSVPSGTTNTGASGATDTDNVTGKVNISIALTDDKGGGTTASTSDLGGTRSKGSVVAGTSMTYTLVFTNNGPSDVLGAKLSSTFSTNFRNFSYTATSTGVIGYTADGSGNINDNVYMPAGSSVTYVVTGMVYAGATGTLFNSAGIISTPVSGFFVTENDTVTSEADLSISSTDNKGGNSTTGASGSVVAGTPMTYTIVVKNNGPSDVAGATVADAVPAGFTVTSSTPVFAGGASIANSSGAGGNINDTVDLPAGGSITYIVSGTLSASATGTLANTATVSPPAGVPDGNLSNNTATDSDNITSQANLSIVKSDSAGGDSATNAQGSIVAGTAMTYTIVVTNSGPSDVSGATVSDALPANFTATGLSHVLVGGASITTSSGAGGGINDTVNLPAGGSIVYFLSGTVSAAATGTLSNSAQVAAGANSASALDTDAVTTQAKISITKTDNTGGNSATGAKGSIAPGSTVTYTVVVSNSGPSDVTGAAIADALPAGISGFSYTASATGGATGFSATGSGAIDDTAVNLPVGGSVTYVVTAAVAPSASGVVTNTAQVTLPGGEVNSGSGSAAVSDNVAATVPQGIGYLAGAPGDGTAQTFVHNLYRELLGREPDPAGEAYWVAQVQQNDTAAGRQTVISSFLNSTEYKDHYITTLYETFLGRAPEAAGLQFWTAKMGEPGTADGHGGSADEKLILAGIVGSDEFYADVGGTSQGFVHALYQDLLGRSSSPAEQTFWVNLLQSQQQNRDGIVRLFLSSPETAHKLLDSFYPAPGGTAANPLPAPGAAVPAHTYDLATVTGLGWENLYLQGPFGNSPEGNDAFFTALAGGEPWDDVQLELLASDQFYNNPNRPVTS